MLTGEIGRLFFRPQGLPAPDPGGERSPSSRWFHLRSARSLRRSSGSGCSLYFTDGCPPVDARQRRGPAADARQRGGDELRLRVPDRDVRRRCGGSRRVLRRRDRPAGRRLAAQLASTRRTSTAPGGGAPAQLLPGLPGRDDAGRHHVREHRPGGAAARHAPHVELPRGRRRRAPQRSLHSACHGAGTVVSDHVRRGLSAPAPGRAARPAATATPTPPRPIAAHFDDDGRRTPRSTCWSATGWSGRWPGCARSPSCTRPAQPDTHPRRSTHDHRRDPSPDRQGPPAHHPICAAAPAAMVSL